MKRCVYCGGSAQSKDHLYPRAKGGGGDRGNIVPACHRCNEQKADMEPVAFFAAYPDRAREFAARAPFYVSVALRLAAYNAWYATVPKETQCS